MCLKDMEGRAAQPQMRTNGDSGRWGQWKCECVIMSIDAWWSLLPVVEIRIGNRTRGLRWCHLC